MFKFLDWIDSLEDDPKTPLMLLIAALICKGISIGLILVAMMIGIIMFIMHVPGGLWTLCGVIFMVCFGITWYHYGKEKDND